jgi:hypothetical protein
MRARKRVGGCDVLRLAGGARSVRTLPWPADGYLRHSREVLSTARTKASSGLIEPPFRLLNAPRTLQGSPVSG